jgi:hypothetical protein
MSPFPKTNVRICFLLDCTASMGPWMDQAKTRIREITSLVHTEHPATDIKVALVGYRDYDDIDRFEIVDFTTPEGVMDALQPLYAVGGDDEAEDVAHAIRHAMLLNWDGDVNMIVHITDAPAHGLAFHSRAVSDRFPAGDPLGVDPRHYIHDMSERNFTYTFVKIGSKTDTMIDAFHTAWTGEGEFKVIDLRPQHYDYSLGDPENEDMASLLSPAVVRAVSQSITRYSESQLP